MLMRVPGALILSHSPREYASVFVLFRPVARVEGEEDIEDSSSLVLCETGIDSRLGSCPDALCKSLIFSIIALIPCELELELFKEPDRERNRLEFLIKTNGTVVGDWYKRRGVENLVYDQLNLRIMWRGIRPTRPVPVKLDVITR